jgi:hypothetical protein
MKDSKYGSVTLFGSLQGKHLFFWDKWISGKNWIPFSMVSLDYYSYCDEMIYNGWDYEMWHKKWKVLSMVLLDHFAQL